MYLLALPTGDGTLGSSFDISTFTSPLTIRRDAFTFRTLYEFTVGNIGNDVRVFIFAENTKMFTPHARTLDAPIKQLPETSADRLFHYRPIVSRDGSKFRRRF